MGEDRLDNMDVNERVLLGKEIVKKGYNCCQAVLGSYVDVLDIDMDTAMHISYGLGGGVGHIREICGALLGGAMVLSLRYGQIEADKTVKKSVEEITTEFLREFEASRGALRCEELKGLKKIEGKEVRLGTCGSYIEETIILLEKYM